jgi:hypothetical protein
VATKQREAADRSKVEELRGEARADLLADVYAILIAAGAKAKAAGVLAHQQSAENTTNGDGGARNGGGEG